jgi:hypothetical protein
MNTNDDKYEVVAMNDVFANTEPSISPEDWTAFTASQGLTPEQFLAEAALIVCAYAENLFDMNNGDKFVFLDGDMVLVTELTASNKDAMEIVNKMKENKCKNKKGMH